MAAIVDSEITISKLTEEKVQESNSPEEDESISYFDKKPSSVASKDTVFTPPLINDKAEGSIDDDKPSSLQDDNLSEAEEPVIIERKMSNRVSSISLSDMNDVSLLEDNENFNPLKTITEALVNGDTPSNVIPKPIPTRLSFVEDESEVSTIASPTRSIFTIFSSFRSSSSTHTSPASSRRPSKQVRGFQETLLAQMEQLNQANTNDPKSTIRQSVDGYDHEFWGTVMRGDARVNKELIKHVRNGIPTSIRGTVWQILAKSKNNQLLTTYMELLKQSSPFEKLIQGDLSGEQTSLYNVVKAYSMYDQQVGYFQSLRFIVDPLLQNMSEEDAFCLLVQLMNKYGLRENFTPEIQTRLYQFDALLDEYLPHVARHLKQQEISSTMYASEWFMTLFANKFPSNVVYRLYDVVFAEGVQSVFKFAIALLKKNQQTIIGLDFEHLLDFLKNDIFEEYKYDDSRFISDACELDIPAKRLAQLEKEHKVQLQKEIANATLVEELQKSNLELQQRYKVLETKTNVLRYEQQDIHTQQKRTLNQLHSLEEEGVTLRTFISTLESTMQTLPAKLVAQTREKHQHLYLTNAELIEKNALLEERLQRAEMELINIKMQYAESENEKEEMHKRLFELKRLMRF